MRKILLQLIISALSFCAISQSQHPKFRECLKNSPDKNTTFCVKDTPGVIDLLKKEGITIKYRTDSWLFITTTPKWIAENQENGNIKQFYYESTPPTLLNDSTRMYRHVDEVHAGSNGLAQGYTGSNVIVGIIDVGVDFLHPDFQDANGNTRVLRIWDQLESYTVPNPYGYGRMWDSTAINAGTCTHVVTNVHGTKVVGTAAGNGLSSGKEKGMAPDANIVMVGTNLNANNWTLTVSDACDYIFKVADSLGMPAVINLSVGNYYGSHDGNDPATVYVEQLLDEQPGRIMVTAAGNAGVLGKFHVGGTVTTDTTFVWFNNNPLNYVFFDMWADTAEAHFDYAFEMDEPSAFGNRGETVFRNTFDNLGAVVYDTIYNGSNRIATMQIWSELIDGAYHFQLFMEHVDSTTYNCRFKTKGNGAYDLWSGYSPADGLNGNTIISVIPSASVVPEIGNYQMPDTLQTIVSSFQCSEKVITVGNYRNRYSYQNKNGVWSTPPTSPVGMLAPSSSKGPNRHDHVKPDISANGDLTLTTVPMWFLNNAANNNNIAIDGWHARMTGTSIASPVVAGIAALYLQKCPSASYKDFKHDMIATAEQDSYSGVSPNYGYGYGKIHALNLLLGPNDVAVAGGPAICDAPVDLSVDAYAVVDSIVWSTGLNNQTLTTSTPDDYHATVYYGEGCSARTDTLTLIQGIIPSAPVITAASVTLTSDVQANYQWTLNGTDLPGETAQTLNAAPPYGVYTVVTTSTDGCSSESNAIDLAASVFENELAKGSVSPNPTTSEFSIKLSDELISVTAFDINGKQVELIQKSNQNYSVSHLKTGTYYLKIITEKGLFHSKVVKM